MIINMNYKLLLVCMVLIQIGLVKSDCGGDLLRCFGESVGNLTKMYEDTNTDVIFNFKIDISAMNTSDIRKLLLASNASLFSNRIDFVDGAAPSRTTIVQLAEVLRNELKKNDVDLTESKLFLKVNNYSTIEVQIFDFIDEDDDGAEESKEDNVDNSTLTLNVNIVMKNSTVNLMDDKGEKISTNEYDDYVYVDLQERLEFGENKTSKEKVKEKNKSEIIDKKYEKFNDEEKIISFPTDTDALAKFIQKEDLTWNKDENEKKIKIVDDAVLEANKAEHKQWNKEEKEKIINFDTEAFIKAKKAEYEQWNKDEQKKLLGFDADAAMKAKKAEYEQWKKDDQNKMLADAVMKAKKAEHEQWNKEELEKLTKFDDVAVIRAKKAEHEQWNKDEEEKLIKFDADAVIRAEKDEHEHWNNDEKEKLFEFDADANIKAKKAEHEQWTNDEKKILFKFDADALINAKKSAHKQWHDKEKEKLLEFDTDMSKKAKIEQDDRSIENEKLLEKFEEIINDAKEEKEQEKHEKWNQDDYKTNKKNKEISVVQKLQEKSKMDYTNEEPIKYYRDKSAANEKNAEYDIIEENMEKRRKMQNMEKYKGEKINEERRNKEEIRQKEIIKEHEQWNKTIQEKLQELEKLEEQEIEIITENVAMYQKEIETEHGNEMELTGSKDFEVEIVTEKKQVNYSKLSKTPTTPKYISDDRNSEIEGQSEKGEEDDNMKKFKELETKIQEHEKEMELTDSKDFQLVTEKKQVNNLKLSKTPITPKNIFDDRSSEIEDQNEKREKDDNMKKFKELESRIQEHETDMELTGSKYFKPEIVTEKKHVNHLKLSKTPITTKNIFDDSNSETEDQKRKGEEDDNLKKFKELERKVQEQKDLILKLKRLQKVKEQQMNEKYIKLKLGQMDEDDFTTLLPTELNDNAKAKVIEEDLLFKANLNRNKAKMVYHVVTERITAPPSIREKEKEEEDLNPIDGFYYDINEDNQTSDYLSINYLDLFKDTTNEDIPYTTLPPSLFVTHKFMESIVEEQKMDDTAQEIRGLLDVAKDNIGLRRTLITPSEQHYSCNTNVTKEDLAEVVFPWIAAVFVRNGSTNAFEYVCDGAIVSDKAVITAGHCLSPDSVVRPPRDVIVILGKRNQRDMTANDIHRASDILVNAYYSVMGTHISHDLAIIKLETTIVQNEEVAAACMLDFDITETDTVIDAITSGWNDNGELTAIHFETLHNVQNNTFCLKDYAYQHVFCDTIGFDVQICPSYGGIYAIKLSNHNWYLKGILSADTTKKGVCIDRNLRFTNLGESEYKNWLKNVIKI